MVEAAQLSFESNAPIKTADKYFLKINAHLEYEARVEDKIVSTINSVSKDFFNSLTLLQAMKLMEEPDSQLNLKFQQAIIDKCNEINVIVKQFILTTLDAVQSNDTKGQVNLEIDPELESKRKKKGVLGKLFGKK